jgi:predicted ester cyclase
MGAIETAQAFTDAFNAQQWDVAARFLTNDCTFSGDTPQVIDWQRFVALYKQWFAAAPDYHIALEQVRKEGGAVVGVARFTGTHTETLDLLGVIPPVPATGIHFTETDNFTTTMRGDKIAAIKSVTMPGTQDILQQLGVSMG